MKTKLLFLLSILSVYFLNAQNTYVPDDNFEQALIDLGYDNVLDDYVFTENINTLTTLNISSKAISDLTGIQDFTALINLEAQNNQLTSINLSTLSNLEVLFIDQNQLTTIDLSSLTNLGSLSASFNQLTEIDISGLENLSLLSIGFNNLSNTNFSSTSLRNFTCMANNLSSVDVSELPNLTFLNVSRNNLSELDASSNVNLETIIASNNNLTALDLSNNIALSALNVTDNNLSNLNVKNGNNQNIRVDGESKYFYATNNPNLNCIQVDDVNYAVANFTAIDNVTSFSINCNPLDARTYVPDNNFEQALIDLGYDDVLDDYVLTANINTLYSLNVANKSINSLEGINDFVEMQHLYASFNNLTELTISSAINLISIDVRNNNLSVLSVPVNNMQVFHSENNPNLRCIQVNDITATNYFAYEGNPDFSIDDYTSFSENCEDRIYVPDDNFEQALIDLGYDNILDDYINRSDVENVTSLDVSNKQIDVLTGIEAFTSLQTLDVGNNSLDVLNLSSNTQLVTLNFIYNWVDEIDISNNVLLQYFFASHNNLTTVNTTSNIALKELELSYNKVKTLDLSANTNLITLDVLSNDQSFGQLSAIDLTQNTMLEEVTLQGNLLTEIDLSQNTNLTKLYIANNNLETINLSNNSSIQWLGLSNNNLISLDLRPLTNLASVNVTNNPLTCISVSDVEYANTYLSEHIDDDDVFSLNCEDRIYVPDDNFEQALIDLGYDDVLNGYVLRENIENIESLNISTTRDNTNKIQDLSGIEAFTNLKSFTISYNDISTVDLSNNLLLETLYAQSCNISSLTLPDSQSLTTLDIHTNNIADLDLSNYVNLTLIQLNVNNFTEIDLSQNTNLRVARLSSNQLTNVDVSNNINLEILGIEDTQISSIDVSINTNLVDLGISRTNITTIDISDLRQLNSFTCNRNNLSTLDLSNNIRLVTFDAIVNPNLRCIKVWDVDYANENWSDNIDSTASFGESCYTEIPDENFEKALIEAKIDDVVDGLVLTENTKTIKSLTLISKNIEDLTGIEAFTGLTNLTVKGNNLTSIDVSQNTVLASLNVIENSLDRLDISNNKSLTVLEASANPDLTCIQVWDVTYAEKSWLDKIDTTASFSLDCDDVWTVEVDKNLKDILTIINGIDKDNDGEITLKEAKEFTGNLDLSGKDIRDINGLQAFENIKSLNLSGNDLKDLSAFTGKKITLVSKTTGKKRQVIAKASKLETLIISNNSFKTLNLEELKDLKVIDISDNPNVGTISIKNGNNTAITSFISTNTPNLSCILVDNPNATYLSSWTKDAKSKFVADLTECRSAVLNTEEFLQKDVTIFPNPVTNFLTIESTKEFDSIEIYNTIGKRVLKTKKRKIDFSNYTSGIYLMRIIAENKLLNKRILKN